MSIQDRMNDVAGLTLIDPEETTTYTYYVGDLCYVVSDDEWDTVCAEMSKFEEYDPDDEDSVQECEGYLDTDNYDYRNPDAAKPFWIFSTAYGDGCYLDGDGNAYSVDSGTIGMIDVRYLDSKKLQSVVERELGHLHTFERRIEAWENANEDGTLVFGTGGKDYVEIATAD